MRRVGHDLLGEVALVVEEVLAYGYEEEIDVKNDMLSNQDCAPTHDKIILFLTIFEVSTCRSCVHRLLYNSSLLKTQLLLLTRSL